MNRKHLLVLSNRQDPKELDHLRKKIAGKITNIVVNRNYESIKIPTTDGVFFTDDIDRPDIQTILKNINDKISDGIPLVRVLSSIYQPESLERVKTCESIDSACTHFNDCFSNS